MIVLCREDILVSSPGEISNLAANSPGNSGEILGIPTKQLYPGFSARQFPLRTSLWSFDELAVW